MYGERYRQEWLSRLEEGGLRRRAELLYQQLDGLQALRRQARRELILASGEHAAVRRLRTIPFLGPVRAAVVLVGDLHFITFSCYRRLPLLARQFPLDRERGGA